MIDPFVAERNVEESQQRELLKEQGLFLDLVAPPPPPPVMQNPDVKITYSSARSDVYKVAELELLKLKMNLTLNKETREEDHVKLASLIQTLISEGSSK